MATAGAFYRGGGPLDPYGGPGRGKGRTAEERGHCPVCGREFRPRVELGGGIRSMADLEEVFALGVTRAVIGSAAVSDPAFLRAAVERYGERIAVGIDTKDGRVKTAGWVEDSGLDYLGICQVYGCDWRKDNYFYRY